MRSASASAGHQPRAPYALAGAVAGILAAAVAIGAAQLVAGLTVPASSPVIAVGQAAIDLTPPPVKDFAISAFGTADKTVLLGGILVVLALYAAVVGILAVRRLAFGMWGLGLFAFIGLMAALTRPDSTAEYIWPSLAGAAAGAFALARLADAARRLNMSRPRPRGRADTGRVPLGPSRPAPETLAPPDLADLPVPPAEPGPAAAAGTGPEGTAAAARRPAAVPRRSRPGSRTILGKLPGVPRATPLPSFPTPTTPGRPAGPTGGGSWSAAA